MRSRTPLASHEDLARLQERSLLITPTYNERSNIQELVESVFASAPLCSLLVVDDESPDGTAEFCQDLQSRFPRLHVLRRQGPRGLGRAYLAGLAYGLEQGYELVGTMDADLSHDPVHFPAMFTLALDRDVVIGSRYVRDGGTINWRIRRIVLSWLANKFAATLLRMSVNDATSGFRLYRAAALRSVALDDITSTGYSFLVELLYRLHRSGCRIGESPIVFYDRTMGESKLASREIYVGALRLLRLRFMRLRASTGGGQPASNPANRG